MIAFFIATNIAYFDVVFCITHPLKKYLFEEKILPFYSFKMSPRLSHVDDVW